eukprot:364659-Chlamydomonas_euryale.AAC.6
MAAERKRQHWPVVPIEACKPHHGAGGAVSERASCGAGGQQHLPADCCLQTRRWQRGQVPWSRPDLPVAAIGGDSCGCGGRGIAGACLNKCVGSVMKE